jgi:hypothetical protein
VFGSELVTGDFEDRLDAREEVVLDGEGEIDGVKRCVGGMR